MNKLFDYTTSRVFNEYEIKNGKITLIYRTLCGVNEIKYFIKKDNIDAVYVIKEFDIKIFLGAIVIFFTGYSGKYEGTDEIINILLQVLGLILLGICFIMYLWRPLIIKTKSSSFISSPFKFCFSFTEPLLTFCTQDIVNEETIPLNNDV